jgi:sugar phosphate isomerase/epimerase
MRIASPGRPHLTYCTNIHPGESLAEVRSAVEHHVVGVKQRLGFTGPFGVGLRLSARAAEELSNPAAFADFQDLLVRSGLYVFTINGFPYGTFHGERVKESVYRPDWLEPERVVYADRLAGLLARLLPDGVTGSVSTVPGAFRERASIAQGGVACAEHVLSHAATLFRIRETTGKLVEVALEPEPCCLLETTADAVRFFEAHVVSRGACERFARTTGLAVRDAEDFLRRHVGVCLDACHLAIEFEDAREAVNGFRAAGIRIGKVQVTTALSAQLSGDPGRDAPTLNALERFAEGVYLHQVVVREHAARTNDELVRHLDLPDALRAARAAAGKPSEWRVHFHVPVFTESLGAFGSTGAFLRDLLGIVGREAVSEHLEVETYTWDVLPPEHRSSGVEDAIAREIRFTMDQMGVFTDGVHA